MIRKTFFENVNDVVEEKGITVEQVYDAASKAMIKAYQKATGMKSARVEFRPEKNEILMYSQQLVVASINEEYEDMDQILLVDAKKIKSSCKVGDVLEQQINPENFGRIAAAVGKQSFSNTVRTAEKENVAEYFKQFENEMISATVCKIDDNGTVTLLLDKNMTTILPAKEVLPNDNLQVGDKIKVYLVSVDVQTKGSKIYVSRSDKNLVKRLMEKYIPEIADGTIEIRGIARDAGDRSKVAIYSNDENVDAIGSCVGGAGQRIKEIVNALNGEKIDLYCYSQVPEELIKNSLQPADVISVIDVDVKAKTSLAIVPDDQLSLAIGKAGQNVRLAVQSCGWKIDIKSATDAKNEGISF